MPYLPEISERKAGEETFRVLKTILDGKKNVDQLGNLSHDSPGTLLEKDIHTTSDVARYKN